MKDEVGDPNAATAAEREPAVDSAETASVPPASSADLTIARRILDGDEAAFVALVDGNHAMLLRVARTFVASEAVAEEVVQETWLAVLEGLRGFEGRSSLRTWIFRILSNRARTRGVREARSVPFSSLEKDNEAPAVDPSRFGPNGRWQEPLPRWDEDTPESLLVAGEIGAVIQRAIEELPPGQRAVLTLRDAGELSAEEACNVLGISETNQRVLLHRARSRIRAALERYHRGE